MIIVARRSLEVNEEYGSRIASPSFDCVLTRRSSRRATRMIIRPSVKMERGTVLQTATDKPARGCTSSFSAEGLGCRHDSRPSEWHALWSLIITLTTDSAEERFRHERHILGGHAKRFARLDVATVQRHMKRVQ